MEESKKDTTTGDDPREYCFSLCPVTVIEDRGTALWGALTGT
jgi:hypothetical protein